MPDLTKALSLLAAIFLVETFMYNFIWKNPPRIPGDIYINNPSIKVYIPFVSALVLSAVGTILFKFLPR